MVGTTSSWAGAVGHSDCNSNLLPPASTKSSIHQNDDCSHLSSFCRLKSRPLLSHVIDSRCFAFKLLAPLQAPALRHNGRTPLLSIIKA